MYSIWHEMLKIASVSGAEPRPRWGNLQYFPRLPRRSFIKDGGGGVGQMRTGEGVKALADVRKLVLF